MATCPWIAESCWLCVKRPISSSTEGAQATVGRTSMATAGIMDVARSTKGTIQVPAWRREEHLPHNHHYNHPTNYPCRSLLQVHYAETSHSLGVQIHHECTFSSFCISGEAFKSHGHRTDHCWELLDIHFTEGEFSRGTGAVERWITFTQRQSPSSTETFHWWITIPLMYWWSAESVSVLLRSSSSCYPSWNPSCDKAHCWGWALTFDSCWSNPAVVFPVSTISHCGSSKDRKICNKEMRHLQASHYQTKGSTDGPITSRLSKPNLSILQGWRWLRWPVSNQVWPCKETNNSEGLHLPTCVSDGEGGSLGVSIWPNIWSLHHCLTSICCQTRMSITDLEGPWYELSGCKLRAERV